MIESLPTFVAVAEAGTFSEVARVQGVAVSSVTRRIDSLESEFGTKLFNRSSRRVLLTDAGEQFLVRAKSILADLADAKESLSASSAEPRGLLTVTVPSAFGRRHVAPAVIEFLKLYPLMQVDLHVSDRVVDLTETRVDVAIRIGSLPSSDLVATRLAPMRRLACASPAYLKRNGRPAGPLELLKHNCLTIASSPTPAGWWSFAGVNKGLPLAVRGNLRTDDTESLLQAALAGVGIVHLATWLVSDAIKSRRLVSLFPEAQLADKHLPGIHAVRMPGRSHTAKAQLFITHLRTVFGEVPAWDRVIAESQ
jgi:DNA-binding transcriptional LysR family regulator